MRHEARSVACRMNVRSRPTIRGVRWSVGDITITRVEEQVTGGIPLGAFLLDFDSGDLERHRWVAERFVGEGETMPLSFHTFALAVGDRRILVDTGCGNHKPRTGIGADLFNGLDTPFLDRLTGGGVRAGVDRHRRVHPPPRRPRRVEQPGSSTAGPSSATAACTTTPASRRT